MTPRQSNANDSQFIPVMGKKSKPKQDSKIPPAMGILLARIGRRQDLERKSINMRDILEAIHSIDPQAYVLPHNCDITRTIKAQTMLKQAQDYTTFMDMTMTHWGKPSDNRSRLAFSFYIASDIFTDLNALKNSQKLQTILAKYKLLLLPHNLLQTDSKAVAFFAGKLSIHTWREDIR